MGGKKSKRQEDPVPLKEEDEEEIWSSDEESKKGKKGGKKKGGKKAKDSEDSGLYASNIDDALDALDITGHGRGGSAKKDGLDRHPERRYKAAFAAYEEARLPEIKKEQPGMRLNQYKELIHKEFQKHPDNPFNQESVAYNATADEVAQKKADIKSKKEKKLTR